MASEKQMLVISASGSWYDNLKNKQNRDDFSSVEHHDEDNMQDKRKGEDNHYWRAGS